MNVRSTAGSAMQKRILIAGLVLLFGVALFYSIQSLVRQTGKRSERIESILKFLQECDRRIPADATVILVSDYYQVRAKTRLYPRPVRILTMGQAIREQSAGSNGWIVTFHSKNVRTSARIIPPP